MTNQTYTVWATSKKEAIAKGTALAEARGLRVISADAWKFPGGAMYHVNWTVRVDCYIAPAAEVAR